MNWQYINSIYSCFNHFWRMFLDSWFIHIQGPKKDRWKDDKLWFFFFLIIIFIVFYFSLQNKGGFLKGNWGWFQQISNMVFSRDFFFFFCVKIFFYWRMADVSGKMWKILIFECQTWCCFNAVFEERGPYDSWAFGARCKWRKYV